MLLNWLLREKALNEEGITTNQNKNDDNASVMAGVNTGVYVRLKEEVPRLVFIPCVCHSLQLAVSEACSEFLPRNVEFIISDTYNWFSHSSSRQKSYVEIYKVINYGSKPLKLVQACQTWWLSIEIAVIRILDQWIELKTHFGIARLSEKCYTAEILSEMYRDDFNHAYLLFLRPFLSEVQRVNKCFESRSADITKMLDDICLLLAFVLNKIITLRPSFDYISSSIEDNLMSLPYLGYEFEEKIKVMKTKRSCTSEQEINIRKRCIHFLIQLAKSIRRRLPRNVDILRKKC